MGHCLSDVGGGGVCGDGGVNMTSVCACVRGGTVTFCNMSFTHKITPNSTCPLNLTKLSDIITRIMGRNKWINR